MQVISGRRQRARRLLLPIIALLVMTAPTGAHALIRIGYDEGAGPDAGAALEVAAGPARNDIRIVETRHSHPDPSNPRYSFTITDPRTSRFKIGTFARQGGCKVRSRHVVFCRDAGTEYATILLGGGNDRLRVTVHGVKQVDRPKSGFALGTIPTHDVNFGAFDGWRIEGGRGRDTIQGTAYQDFIDGGPGSDAIAAGANDDAIYVGPGDGADRIDGGTGTDAVVWTGNGAATLNLLTGRVTGASRLASIEAAQGGRGDDKLIGGPGAELLQGGGGADTIIAGGGGDKVIGDGFFVFGAPGADTIDAGPGDDVVDVSNGDYSPYDQAVVHDKAGPPDHLNCGDGVDSVDSVVSQPLGGDCEDAVFARTPATVPAHPTPNGDGSLTFTLPCPAADASGYPLNTSCEGAVTLERSSDGNAVGSRTYSAKPRSSATVTITPDTPLRSDEPIAVDVKGTFSDQPSRSYEFGWQITPG